MIRFLILFICITLDAFVYMLEKGATIRKINLFYCFKHSFIFAIINVFMFLIGKGLGQIIFTNNLFRFHSFISLIILLSISFFTFALTAKKKDFVEKLDLSFNIKNSIKQAFITSLDTCLLGVYFAVLQTSIPLILICIFLITLVMILSALYIGYTQGAAYQKIIGYLTSIIYFIFAMIHLLGLIH